MESHHPRPFAIVADMRTGSTLLSSSLDRHPQIHCYGELFHSQPLPGNRIPGVEDRKALGARELLRRALAAAGAPVVGFRAMIFLPLPEHGHWPDAWDAIPELEGLRVIHLRRENYLAQYASVRVALQTGVFHPSPENPAPERRPTVVVDPDAYVAWVREREALHAERRRALRGLPSLEVRYHELADEWEETIRRVQDFLGVESAPIAPMKGKQETRPLREVIENYEELPEAVRSGRAETLEVGRVGAS